MDPKGEEDVEFGTALATPNFQGQAPAWLCHKFA